MKSDRHQHTRAAMRYRVDRLGQRVGGGRLPRRKGRLTGTASPTVLAGCLTAGLFLALPYVHVVEPPEKPEMELMTIEQTEWQIPPPLPLPPQTPQEPDRAPTPKPQLTPPRPDMAPLQTVLDFDLSLARIGGDFDLNFSIEPGVSPMDGMPVFALSDIDRAPQPLIQLRPFYPAHARMRQIEGCVTVEFVVAANGQPEDITVLSSEPGALFRTAAVRAVERWRFAPGTRDGAPVAVRVRQRICFQLENGQ